MTGLIAHEWISEHGGSENVLRAMIQAFPDADVACLWSDVSRSEIEAIESWLARTPLRKNKAFALPFMPLTWRRFPLSDYDWALVSSHSFAHHIGDRAARASTQLFVYAHTPARYVWDSTLDSRGASIPARVGAHFLRPIDRAAAQEGAVFAANSHYVKDRIARYWNQPARVIYPPVAVTKLQAVKSWSLELNEHDAAVLEDLPAEFFLGASRFVDYKLLHRVIEVGEECRMPVVLAGSGPKREELLRIAHQASVPVRIIDKPSDSLLYALYEKAALFIFPPVEDFGIMPVEAMALGTPVLVNAQGGAIESVDRLRGGASFPSDGQPIVEAVEAALSLDMEAAAKMAIIFSEEQFISNLADWMGVRFVSVDRESSTSARGAKPTAVWRKTVK